MHLSDMECWYHGCYWCETRILNKIQLDSTDLIRSDVFLSSPLTFYAIKVCDIDGHETDPAHKHRTQIKRYCLYTCDISHNWQKKVAKSHSFTKSRCIGSVLGTSILILDQKRKNGINVSLPSR